MKSNHRRFVSCVVAALVSCCAPALSWAANHLVISNNLSAPETYYLSLGENQDIVALSVPARSTISLEMGDLHGQAFGYTTAGSINGWGWSGVTWGQDSTVILHNSTDGVMSNWYQLAPSGGGQMQNTGMKFVPSDRTKERIKALSQKS